jgi:hypothetical protein
MDRVVNAMVIATRSIIPLVAAFSWLAISNHCALAVTAPAGQTAESACPFHSHPAKPKSVEQPCCKILRALAVKLAKNPMPEVVDVDLQFAELVVLAPPKISFDPISLDTGPPGSISFAELVLQRSILAHAPPFLA